jgi:hypothetical protein
MANIARLFIMLLLAGSALCARAQTAPAAAEPVIAGKVELLEGDVRVFDGKRKVRVVKVGDPVHEGDSIETGAGGEIHLAMEDDGFIAVRPNTKMKIIQYRAQGDDQDKGVIGLLTGSLRSVSGWIGKYHPKSYAVKTKTATIGIRGTDHEPTVIPEGSTEGEPGTYDKVNLGGTYIQTAQGRIDVPERKAAFAPSAGARAMRPRLLDNVPGFFRRSRNEHVIEKKHEAIHRFLDKRRDERRQLIRERIGSRKQDKAAAREGRQAQRQERQSQREQRQRVRAEQRAGRQERPAAQREERATRRQQQREQRAQRHTAREDRGAGRESRKPRERGDGEKRRGGGRD